MHSLGMILVVHALAVVYSCFCCVLLGFNHCDHMTDLDVTW